jgi:hypothetical protein
MLFKSDKIQAKIMKNLSKTLFRPYEKFFAKLDVDKEKAELGVQD